MNFILILCCLLCAAQSAELSQKCAKTNRTYPGDEDGPAVNPRPSPPKEWESCDMLALSCCNKITDYYMTERVKSDFKPLLLAHVTQTLEKVNELISRFSHLHPMIYHNFQESEIDPQSKMFPNQSIARLIVSHFIKDSCEFERSTALGLVEESLPPLVPSLIKKLHPLHSALSGVQTALQTVVSEPLSEQCIKAVIRNGLFTGTTFDKVMCQVCHKNTAHLLPCKNTCTNVARDCLGTFLNISSYLNDLADAFSEKKGLVKKKLLQGDDILEKMEKGIWHSFDGNVTFKENCWKGRGNAPLLKDSAPLLDGLLLSLSNVTEKSADYACTAAVKNKDCWTSNGFVRRDDSRVLPFDEVFSANKTKSAGVLKAESLLRESLLSVFWNATEPPTMAVENFKTDSSDLSLEALVANNDTSQAGNGESDEKPCSSQGVFQGYSFLVCALVSSAFALT